MERETAANQRPVAAQHWPELLWLSLAVIDSQNGCERTKSNLRGRPWMTADGFEYRGSCVHDRPSVSALARIGGPWFRRRPPLPGRPPTWLSTWLSFGRRDS